MVLGIGEGVPIPVPGRAVPPRGWGVGTVWPGKESIVGPGPWQAVGSIVQVRGRPGRRPGQRRVPSWSDPGRRPGPAWSLVGIPSSARYDNAYYQTLGRSGGVETPGLTSSMTWAGLRPGTAAGRFCVPRRSISWSRSLTEAPTREARAAGSRPGALASWCTTSSSRRALKTIRPGSVRRAAARIA